MAEQSPPGRRSDEWREERRRRRESRRGGIGLLLVVAGVMFLLQSLGVWTIRGDVVWPVILIALGAAMILGVLPGRRRG